MVFPLPTVQTARISTNLGLEGSIKPALKKMKALNDYRFNHSLLLPVLVVVLSFSGVWTAFAQEPFLDDFDGPELEAGWTFRDESGPEAHVGFTGDGKYQVNEPSTSANGHAGLGRPIVGVETFTVDVHLHLEDFSGSNSDFKFRFFGGRFLELVYNSFDDIRVFSAERAGNVNRINGIGIADGVPLHFRFIWDAETSTATYFLSIDGGELQEIAKAEGLAEFTPNIVDVVMFKFGEGNGNTPKMFLDRFQVWRGFPVETVIEPLDLAVSSEDSNLVLEWASKPGHIYRVRTSADLSADAESWDLLEVEGSTDIPNTAPLNTLTFPRPDDSTRFYRVEEHPAPPAMVFFENFDGEDPGWATGFGAGDTEMNTLWELGDPAGGPVSGPEAAFSGTNCFGTNLAANYGDGSATWLRTPAIDLGEATAATLAMMHWVDIDPFDDLDGGTIRVLDADSMTELGIVETNIAGLNTAAEWEEYSMDLPAEALGHSVVLEFLFESDLEDTLVGGAGWYLDDVSVSTPAP